jgi:hypothetical protein
MASTIPSTEPAHSVDAARATQAAQADAVPSQLVARAAGIMYLITIVASIPAQFVLYHPVLGDHEYVLGPWARHHGDVGWLSRVLHLVGKGNKPATMPITVPVLRVLEACRGQRTNGRLLLRPISGNPIDRRDAYRMVSRIARVAGIPRHISPHSLRHAAITNALDAGVPLRDAQILARHADPRTTEHYDRARGNLDRHGVHFLTAYVAGV